MYDEDEQFEFERDRQTVSALPAARGQRHAAAIVGGVRQSANTSPRNDSWKIESIHDPIPDALCCWVFHLPPMLDYA